MRPLLFQVSFLILRTMESVILGNHLFSKNNVTLDPTKRLLELSGLTVLMNQNLSEQGKQCFITKLPKLRSILLIKITNTVSVLSAFRM